MPQNPRCIPEQCVRERRLDPFFTCENSTDDDTWKTFTATVTHVCLECWYGPNNGSITGGYCDWTAAGVPLAETANPNFVVPSGTIAPTPFFTAPATTSVSTYLSQLIAAFDQVPYCLQDCFRHFGASPYTICTNSTAEGLLYSQCEGKGFAVGCSEGEGAAAAEVAGFKSAVTAACSACAGDLGVESCGFFANGSAVATGTGHAPGWTPTPTGGSLSGGSGSGSSSGSSGSAAGSSGGSGLGVNGSSASSTSSSSTGIYIGVAIGVVAIIGGVLAVVIIRSRRAAAAKQQPAFQQQQQQQFQQFPQPPPVPTGQPQPGFFMHPPVGEIHGHQQYMPAATQQPTFAPQQAAFAPPGSSFGTQQSYAPVMKDPNMFGAGTAMYAHDPSTQKSPELFMQQQQQQQYSSLQGSSMQKPMMPGDGYGYQQQYNSSTQSSQAAYSVSQGSSMQKPLVEAGAPYGQQQQQQQPQHYDGTHGGSYGGSSMAKQASEPRPPQDSAPGLPAYSSMARS
ncbi:hypothetical protein HK101_000738 [Irineochytrium annulatum]|nr:hypothetical protein HK101_000738 [Irineochytrium annulatum]